MYRNQASIIEFPVSRTNKIHRKTKLNANKEGSVRNINGNVYVDFIYLGERVREAAGLPWTENNAKLVRGKLDQIIVMIKSGIFVFAEVFPRSKKAEYFSEMESKVLGRNKTPDQVIFNDHVWVWYDRLKNSGLVSPRTLGFYKGIITTYLIPFFGERLFGHFNKPVFGEFVSHAKDQKLRGKSVHNESIRKFFIPLKMICEDAAIQYGWGGTYDPFFGFKLPKKERDSYEKIYPFSIKEQDRIVAELPIHWKPYFCFAFASGISQGEQAALKSTDIDWNNKTVCIKNAMTRDDNGKPMEGSCKNKYRRRTIILSPKMLSALKNQKSIYDKFQGGYFFCSETGKIFDPSNVRSKVWIPALKKAGIEYREMRQTRHSFATYHLSQGKNPLQIAKVMGHRNAEMVLKVYSRYIENSDSIGD